MSTTSTISVIVNGQKFDRTVEVRLTLADFLREELDLTGTHLGCEHGVCGACTILFDGQAIYSVLDAKPKTTPLRQLRRVKNILANPQVSLVVDHYEENWDKLQYILVSGDAELLESDEKWVVAIAMLREKYPQYQAMDLDQSPVIKITPVRYSPWSSQPPP